MVSLRGNNQSPGYPSPLLLCDQDRTISSPTYWLHAERTGELKTVTTGTNALYFIRGGNRGKWPGDGGGGRRESDLFRKKEMTPIFLHGEDVM